jgi:predicted Zn-dependent peptidase
LSASFTEGPYRWSTVGYEKDVLGLTIADARAFHEKHYVPSNMVGVLVGDLNIAAAKKIIQEEFGKYEKRPAPPGPAGEEGPRGNILEKMKFRAEPSISIAYHKPTLPDPSEYTFDVINALLCDGMSSRLEKRLVYEKRMAEGLSCTVSYPGSRLPTLFLIWIDPLKPNAPRALLKEVSEEMAKLRNEPVGEEELSRVRKLTAASFVFALEQNMELAQGLAEFQTDFGNWRLLASYPKMVSAVSADDVMRVAKKYLSDDNRIVVERERSGK